jgi:hypothetical protein
MTAKNSPIDGATDDATDDVIGPPSRLLKRSAANFFCVKSTAIKHCDFLPTPN